MDTRAFIVAVLAVALVGGCASAAGKMMYEKAGVSAEQRQRDLVDCTLAAIENSDQRGAEFLAIDRDAVDACMQARGYRMTAIK
jgi:hypothetical protein